jgi:hypothetical protein
MLPSADPSSTLTVFPTPSPSIYPTAIPSSHPSCNPSMLPSEYPSMLPSADPSSTVTVVPSALFSVMYCFCDEDRKVGSIVRSVDKKYHSQSCRIDFQSSIPSVDDVIRYNILVENKNSKGVDLFFDVNQCSGEIIVNRTLNFVLDSYYHMIVSISSGDNVLEFVKVYIQIVKTNQRPMFISNNVVDVIPSLTMNYMSTIHITVQENLKVGEVFNNLTQFAYDKDDSINRTFTAGFCCQKSFMIEPLSEDASYFSIKNEDMGNGRITLTKRLNFNIQRIYILTVRVTDEGGLFNEALLYIHVVDHPQNPVIINPYLSKYSLDEPRQILDTTASVSAKLPILASIQLPVEKGTSLMTSVIFVLQHEFEGSNLSAAIIAGNDQKIFQIIKLQQYSDAVLTTTFGLIIDNTTSINEVNPSKGIYNYSLVVRVEVSNAPQLFDTIQYYIDVDDTNYVETTSVTSSIYSERCTSQNTFLINRHCSNCSNADIALVTLILIIVLWVASAFRIISHSKNDSDSKSTTLMKHYMAFDYLQLIALFSFIEISNAPSFVHSIFDILSIFNFNPVIFIGSCWNVVNDNQSKRLETAFVVIASLPLLLLAILAIISCIIVFIWGFYPKDSSNIQSNAFIDNTVNYNGAEFPAVASSLSLRKISNVRAAAISVSRIPLLHLSEWTKVIDMILISFAICMIIMYSTLCINAITLLDCRKYSDGDNSYYYLSAIGNTEDGSGRCYVTGSIQQRLFIWAIVSYVIYGIGIPLFVFYVTGRIFKRRALIAITIRDKINPQHDELSIYSSRITSEVFLNYHWLLYSMIRKSVIILILLLTGTEEGSTLSICLIMLVVYFSYLATHTNIQEDSNVTSTSASVILKSWFLKNEINSQILDNDWSNKKLLSTHVFECVLRVSISCIIILLVGFQGSEMSDTARDIIGSILVSLLSISFAYVILVLLVNATVIAHPSPSNINHNNIDTNVSLSIDLEANVMENTSLEIKTDKLSPSESRHSSLHFENIYDDNEVYDDLRASPPAEQQKTLSPAYSLSSMNEWLTLNRLASRKVAPSTDSSCDSVSVSITDTPDVIECSSNSNNFDLKQNGTIVECIQSTHETNSTDQPYASVTPTQLKKGHSFLFRRSPSSKVVPYYTPRKLHSVDLSIREICLDDVGSEDQTSKEITSVHISNEKSSTNMLNEDVEAVADYKAINRNYVTASIPTHDNDNNRGKQDNRSMQSIAMKEFKQSFGKALTSSHKLYNSLRGGKKSNFIGDDQINMNNAVNDKQKIRSSGKSLTITPYKVVKVLPPIVAKEKNTLSDSKKNSVKSINIPTSIKNKRPVGERVRKSKRLSRASSVVNDPQHFPKTSTKQISFNSSNLKYGTLRQTTYRESLNILNRKPVTFSESIIVPKVISPAAAAARPSYPEPDIIYDADRELHRIQRNNLQRRRQQIEDPNAILDF